MSNQVAKWNAELAAIEGRSLAEKAAARKELASSPSVGPGANSNDFDTLKVAEGRFIDLAIHKNSFLDDCAITQGLDVETPPIWKTRYAPTVGVMTGSVYGKGPSTLYITQDNYATLTPFVVDAEDIKVPKMALTQDPERLGQRQAGLARQAEALKLSMETYLVNFITQQPLGTDLATSVANQLANSNPYGGKTVYIADSGVQSGTYETSNNINVSSEGGLTMAVMEAIINQAYLSGRSPRTVHIPVAGLPWRTLIRVATPVVSTMPGSGTLNPDLKAVPPSVWEEMWKANFDTGVALNVLGHTVKFKSNNVLAQGNAIVTTNLPAAEIFNIKGASVSLDYTDDPKNTFFDSHYEKREMAIAMPEPWVRNVWFVNFGDTSF